MKKVKTLLVTAVAALSLSACTFQDVKDWTKNAGSQVSGFFSSLLEKLGVKKSDKGEKEEKACTHEDKNHDGTCDLCGVTGLEVVHVDENHDHNCDVCGAVVSEHADANNDFVCDVCGKEFAVTGVELDTSDVQLLFAKDEEFNADGLKVIATSEFGNQKELEFTVSSPDMTTVGDKEVEVTYGNGENDKLSYSINVSYWSDEDLEVLTNGTYLGYYGKTPLPYLAGFNMRVETELDDQGQIESFKVVADNITGDAYLDLYNAFGDIEVKATISKKEVTFKFAEVAGQFEGFHDLSDIAVLRLVPYFVDDRGDNERFFVKDEYYILGINEQGQLNIEVRDVNAMLDGMFFGDEFADGTYYFPAQYNSYLKYIPEILGYYYSELSQMAFLVPEIGSTVTVMPVSYFSLYPLNENLDVFDLAWAIELDNATQAETDAYIAALKEAGYEEVENSDGSKSYVIDNELFGYIELAAKFYPEEGTSPSAMLITFYYIAPDSYTNHLTLQAVALEKMLETELEIDNDLYEDYGVVIAEGYHPAGELTSGEAVAEKLARQLLESNFDVTSEIEYNEKYEQYVFAVANDEAEFEFYVDKAAEEEQYFFEVYISDLEKPVSISNAEKAAQAAFKGIYNKLALKGVDYVENEDGTFSFVFSGGQGTAEQLKTVAEDSADVLGDSFALANSEADGENAWVATFNDVDNNVQAKVTASLDGEGNVSVTFSFENHKFTTPETTLVAFLTEYNGVAPSASDYSVDEKGACSVEFALEGTHEASELQSLSEALIAKFGEGFEKVSSEAGADEGTWAVVLNNESTGVQAQINASIDADGKVTIVVGTNWIPQIVYNAAKVAEDYNANLAAAGISLSLKLNETTGVYSLAAGVGTASDETESTLKSGAYTLASFLPDYATKSFELYGDPTADGYYDLFGDKSYYYYMVFTTVDGAQITIVSYVSGTTLVAQISVK